MRPTDVVSLFAPAFTASGVEWMIAGGVAAIVYGEPRQTQDIDLVGALHPRDAATLATQFPDTQFYCSPVEVIAAAAARDAFDHFNVLHLESHARADVYLAGNDALARQGLATKRTLTLAGLSENLPYWLLTLVARTPDHHTTAMRRSCSRILGISGSGGAPRNVTPDMAA